MSGPSGVSKARANKPTPRSVVDDLDWSHPDSEVREAVQWLEDTFTAAEAELHRRRMAQS